MSKKSDRSSDEFSYALDMVAIISRMDFVLVPREANPAMLAAGAAAGEVSPVIAERIYRAMTSTEV
jgi:hypothetical protein